MLREVLFGPLLALAGLSISPAQAAEPETVTLLCEGPSASHLPGGSVEGVPRDVSLVVDVSWKDRTVTGFVRPAIITYSDDVTISFAGSYESDVTGRDKVEGTMNRVTGEASVRNKRSNRSEIGLPSEMQADAAVKHATNDRINLSGHSLRRADRRSPMGPSDVELVEGITSHDHVSPARST
jgi:hypothetical protein